MKRTRYEWQTLLTVDEAANALRSAMDEKQWNMFSLSGYSGDREFVGNIGSNSFTIQRRRYYRNDFASVFYGQIEPGPQGVLVRGYFDSPRWTKYFMGVWLSGVAVIGGTIFVSTAIDMFTASQNVTSNDWLGLIVPPAMFFFGVAMPRFGRFLSSGAERRILNHVSDTLGAIESVAHPGE